MAKEYGTFKDYPLDKGALFHLILKTLELCEFTITDKNESIGQIQGKTKINIWSWGEQYTISIVKENKKSRVYFKSKCAIPTQIIDWGKNRKNAEQFYKILDKIVEYGEEGKDKIKMVKCPKCGRNNSPDDSFCEKCGYRIKKEIKKITVRFILAWIFGVLFVLSGAVSFSDSFFGGFLIILGGLVILPPVGNMIKNKFHIELSGWLKLIAFLILVGIGISLTQNYSPEDVEKADCEKVSKGVAMGMCLDMAEQCGVYNWRQACDLVYENERGGGTLCKIAKDFSTHCKN